MIYAFIIAVGLSYVLTAVWWVPFLVALILLVAANEAKIQRKRLAYEREWRLREDLYRMGQRKPR